MLMWKQCLLLLLVSACLCYEAQSHGFLLQPASRTFVSYKLDPPEKRDYNPQGANAGGKQRVYDGGRLHWPNGRFGLCGEAWDEPHKRYEQPGRVTASYTPGSTITIHLLITANHWGRMEFNLCPRGTTAQDYKKRCMLLQRADDKGPHWTLPPGELPDPQGRPLLPAFQDGSFSTYIYPENDDFRQTPVFTLKYRLPAGYTCESCFLHWYWLTGNSCNPPCEASDPLYPNCNRLEMGFCNEPKSLLPEEFWGCSDVRISNTSKQGPHINASFSDLSDRLVAALADQERLEKQHGPARPLEQYWKAELLAAADKLDEMHHQHQHSRRTQHGVGLEGPQEGSVPASAQQQQQQGP